MNFFSGVATIITKDMRLAQIPAENVCLNPNVPSMTNLSVFFTRKSSNNGKINFCSGASTMFTLNLKVALITLGKYLLGLKFSQDYEFFFIFLLSSKVMET